MRYAKEIMTIVFPLALGWFILYLICAFVSASWTISEWTQQARIICAIWGSCFGAGIWYRLDKVL
jgi:steroid 5-alpha reductase family enzyme